MNLTKWPLLLLCALALAARAGAQTMPSAPNEWVSYPVPPVRGGLDFREMLRVRDARDLSAEARIALGVAYLKAELAEPTQARWAPGLGGPREINSGTVQRELVTLLSFPARTAPAALRGGREHSVDSSLRDLLTIALGLAGKLDVIPDLRRIARTYPEGAIRASATTALGGFVLEPAYRLHTDTPVYELTLRTRRDVRSTLLVCLNDSFSTYAKDCMGDGEIAYPVRGAAWRALPGVGLRLKPNGDQPWEVRDERGRVVWRGRLSRPVRPTDPAYALQSRKP